MPNHDEKAKLHRAMGYRDVVLFFITACVNLQWVATAGGAGPSAITFWLLAFATMTIPLGFCVLELSSRYPEEGGIYIWSKRAFGDRGGFMTGWIYWLSNLPYFPAVLFFAVGNALYMGGERWLHLSESNTYFLVASLTLLFVATWLNLIGLEYGKWLNNIGAIARWVAFLGLLIMGGLALYRFGSATEFTIGSLIPAAKLKHLFFWSSIAFAVTGLEGASFMGEEIRDARRTIPRAIFTAAPLVALINVVGTIAVMVALPAAEVGRMQGVMEAMASAADRLGLPGLAPIASFLIALSALGSVGVWLGATARLPFVAGIDHFLPKGFGRIHPKWGTPHVALIVQSIIAAACVILARAGSNVAAAYEFLVSMAIISYLIPFLFMFAALIKVQNEPVAEGVYRVPGGKPVAYILAIVGIISTTMAILLSFVPAEDDPDPWWSFTKILVATAVLIVSGFIVYAVGNRSRKGSADAH